MKIRAFAVLLAAACQLAQAEPVPLPALGANLERTTVSGFSSGGFLATQLATAYSSRFVGVSIIAGGTFDCADTYPQQNRISNASTTCMTPMSRSMGPNGKISWNHARVLAEKGLIDPVANISKQTVFLFSGSNDHTIKTIVVDAVNEFYQNAGVPPTRLTYRRDVNAGHAFITNHPDDVECPQTSAPYINNCGYNLADAMLSSFYDNANPPSSGKLAGRLLEFDQREFISGSRSGMDSVGYVYVPDSCRQGACAVHVALHGCMQGVRQIGDRFYRSTGYNEFADTNRLIVIYPQVQVSAGIPWNPKGCWDFWGYSSDTSRRPDAAAFYVKGAPQMAAIMRMIDRLGRAPASP